MLGMGSGQPNRVKSLQIALEKAGKEAEGAALASDAFFPFGKMLFKLLQALALIKNSRKTYLKFLLRVSAD